MPLYAYKGKRPRLGRDVFVAPNAVVIGDVELGDEASVWFSAVIRGDEMPIRFGKRTNLQDGSVVHITSETAATTVGDDVTVGHMVLLHGCTVGDAVLVGMGSILLDGSVVEDGCIIAAGSLVSPGTRIPARSLAMGRPARVVRAVTEEDRAWIEKAGRLYVGYARSFMSKTFEVVAPPAP
jgi:carbonic anhydrase/acetyltransferase-like protein (isoleucine patch superfamily)